MLLGPGFSPGKNMSYSIHTGLGEVGFERLRRAKTQGVAKSFDCTRANKPGVGEGEQIDLRKPEWILELPRFELRGATVPVYFPFTSSPVPGIYALLFGEK